MRETIEDGRSVLAIDYNTAVDFRDVLYAGLSEIFERFDAILTPSATGEAPNGLDYTGDPINSTLWTYLGVPTISLPLLMGGNGLPVGVQLVGPRGDDARLLRSARWLAGAVETAEAEQGEIVA